MADAAGRSPGGWWEREAFHWLLAHYRWTISTAAAAGAGGAVVAAAAAVEIVQGLAARVTSGKPEINRSATGRRPAQKYQSGCPGSPSACCVEFHGRSADSPAPSCCDSAG